MLYPRPLDTRPISAAVMLQNDMTDSVFAVEVRDSPREASLEDELWSRQVRSRRKITELRPGSDGGDSIEEGHSHHLTGGTAATGSIWTLGRC
jgi:hypothetical protein